MYTLDRESLKDIEVLIQKLLVESSEIAFYISALLLLYEENYDKSRSLIMRIANSDSSLKSSVICTLT